MNLDISFGMYKKKIIISKELYAKFPYKVERNLIEIFPLMTFSEIIKKYLDFKIKFRYLFNKYSFLVYFTVNIFSHYFCDVQVQSHNLAC